MAMKLTPEAIRELFEGMVGRSVAVNPAKPLLVLGKQQWILGVYDDDDNALAGAALADVSLANFAGAALALVPPERAQSGATEGSLSEELSANFYEILNVGASLYPAAGGPHVRLVKMTTDQPKSAIVKLIRKPKSRTDVTIKVEGYGQGRITFVAA